MAEDFSEKLHTNGTAVAEKEMSEHGKTMPTSASQEAAAISAPSLNDQDASQDPAAEPPVERPGIVAEEDFSVFTIRQKKAIVIAGSFIGWFSPMSGSIYYPALNQISQDLHESGTNINLTVTTYLIIQGLAPMMIAGFSDKAGRRPAYFICFTIYIIANLALALQNNYIALLLLRMLQSAGSSGTIALANGLVGDLIVSAERGKYIAFASVGTILGPTLSPIIGGLISQYLGWHWIFWFLLILSVVAFIFIVLFLPETCRNIVGDGSVPPPWTSWNITDHIRHKRRAERGMEVDENKLKELRKNYKISFPNPMGTLIVMTNFEAALLLLATGVALACFYAISTGASQVFSTIYGFDDLYISLMFLPLGAGGIIAVFTNGRLVDWNYRRHARKLNFPLVKNRQTDLAGFPIERARIEVALPQFALGVASIVGYGWMMTRRVSLAGPIVMLLLLGYALNAGFQVLNILMVDIYPGQPATATAANNVFRCLLGAAASAAVVPMTDAMGYGWAYTTLALLFLVACAGPVASMRYGVAWRRALREKEARRAERAEAKRRRREDKRRAAAAAKATATATTTASDGDTDEERGEAGMVDGSELEKAK